MKQLQAQLKFVPYEKTLKLFYDDIADVVVTESYNLLHNI